MKKLFLLLLTLIAISPALFAEPTYTGGYNGLVIGSKNDYLDTGLTIGAGELLMTKPSCNAQFVYLDVATASQTAFFNFSVSTATVIASATTYTLANADYTDTIVPRNLVIIASCTPTSATYAGTALITGVNQLGDSTTETVTLSTAADTTNGTGNVAWSSVTSIKFTSTSTTATSMKFQVGSGVKIGLPCNLNAATQALKVIEAGSLSTTYTLSLPYNTITFAAAPDGSKDYTVYAKPKKR